MGHRTDERRYPATTRLLYCPDCGAIWACLSTGAMLWRKAACCPLCKDGPELGRRRVEERQQLALDDALADHYHATGRLSAKARDAIKRTIATTRKIAKRHAS